MTIPGIKLNLFYEEPDPDRWLPLDRYPRRLVRRIVRGKPRPGGVMTIALNLMRGLDKIGVAYRFNDYRYIKKHPEEIACIIGKPHVLFERKWENPVILGAGVYSHPVDCPDLFERYPNVKRFLVPGDWMRRMCEPFYGQRVVAWPVGIDTGRWKPLPAAEKKFDFLIYDKIRWEYDRMRQQLIEPIVTALDKANFNCQFIRYGSYGHPELAEKLANSKAVIFLCEHETQGLACQQILASGIPVLAWDRGGYWQDPDYYPHRVKFGPVSSVPYWDDRCGIKFTSAADFPGKLESFWNRYNEFKPRDYILENLTLERCAEKYVEIHQTVQRQLI